MLFRHLCPVVPLACPYPWILVVWLLGKSVTCLDVLSLHSLARMIHIVRQSCIFNLIYKACKNSGSWCSTSVLSVGDRRPQIFCQIHYLFSYQKSKQTFVALHQPVPPGLVHCQYPTGVEISDVWRFLKIYCIVAELPARPRTVLKFETLLWSVFLHCPALRGFSWQWSRISLLCDHSYYKDSMEHSCWTRQYFHSWK